MSRHTAYISVGSNMESRFGSPESTALRAVNELQGAFGSALQGLRASSVYMTEPQGHKDQPWFANLALELGFVEEISPQSCLAQLLKVEAAMGRTRAAQDARGAPSALRYGPRVIDLDLLLFDQTVCSSNTLMLPHPRMLQRAFVLVPLKELAADLSIPDTDFTVAQALQCLDYRLDGARILQA